MKKYLLVSVLMILPVLPALADVIRVPIQQSTIQNGINAASDGDTVLVADGTYTENINFNGKAITVASRFIMDSDTSHITNTIIDGSQPANADSGSVVYFVSGEDTTSILAGFTITNGSGTLFVDSDNITQNGGGGIFCYNSGASIQHNIISGNTVTHSFASVGGGMLAQATDDRYRVVVANNTIQSNSVEALALAAGGGLGMDVHGRIKNNTVTENRASSNGVAVGGGTALAELSDMPRSIILSQNVVTHNQAVTTSNEEPAQGGGIYTDISHILISDNTIRLNRVSSKSVSNGAGLFVQSTSPDYESRIEKNMISENTFLDGFNAGGGVLLNLDSSLTVQDNHIESNSATWGGGIWTVHSNPYLQGNKITTNNAMDIGGGLLFLESNPVVRNNLIVKNTAVNGGGGLWIEKVTTQSARQVSHDIRHPQIITLNAMRLEKSENFYSSMHQSDYVVKKSTAKETVLINNTIADNSVSGYLGGGGLHAIFASPRVLNTIFWGNQAASGAQIEGAVYTGYCNVQGGYPGTGNIDLDPQFENTEDYYLQSTSSPCIDAGHPDPLYNDTEDPNNPGFAMWPALGGIRNDMGAWGGNPELAAEKELLGPHFRDFVHRIYSVESALRPAIVDSFMNAIASIPFIEDKSIAYFLYRGNANSVSVPGDANEWNPNAFPMTRLADTNLWYRENEFESDARLDYKYVVNGSNWILDPLNPNQVTGGFGPNSELAMPDYVQPVEIEFNATIPHGTIHASSFSSTVLGNTRAIQVYTPPNYEVDSNDSFPVVLFHDGQEYISLADAHNVLDALIAENRIIPVIGVFVPPVDRDNEYAFSKTAQFESFIINELMPFIDSEYRTKRDPKSRAMIGISFGGLITTQICYNHADQFGLCGPYSPSYWAKNMAVYNSVVNGPQKDICHYLDWGTYEPGISFNARAMRDNLLSSGYETIWNEWHEGHSWGNWRAHLDNALEFFFPYSDVSVDQKQTVPYEFQLLQNFPNPFNPATTIQYSLKHSTHVTLQIYNTLGQHVHTLVDMEQTAGVKSILWDGHDDSGLKSPSGVYIYKLESDDFTQTRKMILLQ